MIPTSLLPPQNDFENRFDIFEPGDLTALICLESPDYQQIVITHLTSMDYKIHVGMFAEDISLKLKTHVYDVVIIDENFGGSTIPTNPILHEAVHLHSSQRRNQFIVLLGPTVMTNDEMMAFIYSVDLVFNTADLNNLKPVLRRGVARQKEFYQVFSDQVRQLGTM